MTDKATHKMVNGKRVDLTDEEARAIEDEWRSNKKAKEDKALELEKKKLRRAELLDRLGLTEEEAALLNEIK